MEEEGAVLMGNRAGHSEDQLHAAGTASAEHRNGIQNSESKARSEERLEEDSEQRFNLDVFHFATSADWILIVLGILTALVTGMGIPALSLLIRDLVNEGFSRGAAGVGSRQITSMAWNFLYIGIGMFGAAWISNVCLQVSAARQGLRIRIEYLRGLLRQDLGWQDEHGGAAVAVNFETDCADVQAGIGEKLFLVAQNLAVAVGCTALALWQAWHETLILLGALPFLFIIFFLTSRQIAPYAAVREAAWKRASGLMEEALASIRTTLSLAAEPRTLRSFGSELETVAGVRAREVLLSAAGAAVLAVLAFGGFGLGLWFGAWLQTNEHRNYAADRYFNGSDTALCFIAVLIAAFYLTQVGPAWAALRRAAATVRRILRVTARRPAIDILSEEGQIPGEDTRGRLQLEDIHLAYASRPDSAVLSGVSLDVAAGSKVALVGASGSGKSSVLLLVMRLYDPTRGRLLLDGYDLRSLNVRWLRQRLGFVPQEPLLFSASVADNVRITAPDASPQAVEAACRTANAHEFVMALPQGYATGCGERGAGLSGGQKQRLALARCLVADPKLLLLDEATSALDAQAERTVQAAMDEVSRGRTTLVVAHRLSSVRDADTIVVLDKGRVLEKGNHETLIEKGQAYAKLVQAQTVLGSADIVLESEEGGDEEEGGPEGEGPEGSRTSMESSEMSYGGGGEEEERNLFAVAGVGGALLPRPGGGRGRGGGEGEGGGGVCGCCCGGGGGGRAMLRLLSASGRYPLAVTAGCVGVVVMAALVPLLSFMIVEVIRVLFQCFTVDVPIFIETDRDEITVGYFDSAEGCEAPCYFDIISGLGIQPPETCSEDAVWKWEELCMDLGRFSIKFYKDHRRHACYDGMTEEVLRWVVYMILTGVAAAIAVLLQSWGMRALADKMGRDLRLGALAGMLRQSLDFFDDPRHAAAALVNTIVQDVSMVEEAVGVTVGFLAINLLLALGSMVLSLYRGWVLALICLAVFPAKFIFQWIRAWYEARFSPLAALQRAAQIVVEAVTSVRTVAAGSLNERVQALYERELPEMAARQLLLATLSGFLFATSLFLQFMVYFVAFIVGANFMVWPPLDPEDQPYSFLDVLQVFFSVAFMGFAVQLMAALVGDLSRAMQAAARVFAIIDTEPRFSTETGGQTLPTVNGNIEFRDVSFSYPQRVDALVLSGLSLSLKARSTTALVGPSGSGKSTVIQLILRFYDPTAGAVTLDGVDLRGLDLRWLRRQLALVSQEPILFSGSVADNIRYGKAEATDLEVERAAKKANAHGFITQFSAGYATGCGERGAGLSGGQKQRLALARCLVADPKLLLLDEATSALDAQAERTVQAALDKVSRSRTCVVVAHRLSTIRHADTIAVLSGGRVVEQGNHDSLMAGGGAYSQLVQGQLGARPPGGEGREGQS